MRIEKLKLRLLRIGIIISGLLIVGFGCSSLLAFYIQSSLLAELTSIRIGILVFGGIMIAACCSLRFYVQRLLSPLYPKGSLDEREKQAPTLFDAANASLWHTVFEYSLEGVMMTDVWGSILKVNPAFTKVTGYSADECLGKNPRLLKSGMHDAAFYQKMWDTIHTTGLWQSEIWNRRKNGEAYLQWLTIRAITNDAGDPSHYVAIFHDITDIKRHQEQIIYQSHHDALTGLPNRQLFQDHLHMALAHARRNALKIGVLFLDLDNFKKINDSLGHHLGDLLLQKVAIRLKQCCRCEDTVARFGGDEFMILFPDIKENGHHLLELVQRLLQVFAPPFLLRNHEVTFTASIGVTVYPEDGEDVATLIKNAELAMYRAKEYGRNTYMLYTKTMYTLAVERMELETSLRNALKNQEFRVYYQPQINLSTGMVSGTEALVRWQRSASELVPPDRFIPLAEETGLILPLGEWVLRTACEQTKTWHEAGFPWLTVAVNLSARQFQDKCLVRLVREVLDDTRLEPRFLRLEITENTLMKNMELATNIMYALERIGVYLSIDDFGTGYSSLSYLKCFPLKEIKIDKSFVREIPEHQDDVAIARAILSLAHSLNLRVLAEGVETHRQLDFMRQYRCDEIQGYVFSQPICADDLIGLLREGKKLPI